jgi:hypothetical protein
MADPVIEVVRLGMPWPTVDPFLFCVHHLDHYPAGDERLGPDASLAGRDLGQDFAGIDGWRMYHGRVVPGFPQHPHRGFETVTYARQGYIDHSDSLGAAARFGRGDVQWMTAGEGVVHAEMFPLLDRTGPNPVELFQIWLNLPAADKLSAPHFTMLWDEQVPRLVPPGGGVTVTVIAGALEGCVPPSPPPHSWAADPDHDVAIWHATLAPGTTWTMPPARSVATVRTLYVFAGSALRVGDHEVAAGHGARVAPDVALDLSTDDGAEVLVLQGRPIGEPVVQYGPFVMATRAEIQQAIADYQRTGFGGWPWPDDDPVHGRDRGRFARHVDGRVEEPTGG